MRIQELEFRDKDADWELAPTHFFPDLTLLVGVSGVGKTRILLSILKLRAIADVGDDNHFWGIQWRIQFITDDGSEFCWSGAVEERESENGESADARPRILRESLSKEGHLIVERDSNGITLCGRPMPKLSPYESVVTILSEEEAVAPVHNAFKQVLPVDQSAKRYPGPSLLWRFAYYVEQLDTLEKIREESGLFEEFKLALVYDNDREAFDRIATRFMGVFPQVENVDILHTQIHDSGDYVEVRIKERGVGKWILGRNISSGMWRTLMHLCRMALWPDGMVILIDEFENSLGVNCLDFITDDLVGESSRHQFIITSHHPYIVNRIDTRHWKIVVRDGAVVSTRDASEFGLDDSSHDAFIKLMNLPLYQEGITVE